MTIRQKFYDVAAQRERHLDDARAALDKDDMEAYAAAMDAAKALNPELEKLQADVLEEERYKDLYAPGQPGQTQQKAQEAQDAEDIDLEQFRGMSAEEINRQWDRLLERIG